jgi:limonene-1,2-epoxide hydrolase
MSKSKMSRRHAVIAGGLGALAAFAKSANAAPKSKAQAAAEKANIALVTEFCQSWNEPDKAVDLLAPDASVRMFFDKPAISGAAAVGNEMKKFMGLKDKVKVSIRRTFAEGPVVVNVRTDTLTSPGKPDQVFNIVGIFHVRAGKIHEWIDYNEG